MISPQNPVSTTDVNGRGFVADSSAAQPAAGGYDVYSPRAEQWRLPTFWESVVAGTLLTYSIAIMSAALMLGCRVGIAGSGAVSFGWGAAIWLVATACIAWFFGGWGASCFSWRARTRASWLHGLAVWAVSVPLFMVIGAVVASAVSLVYGPRITNNTELFVSHGGAWTVFIALILGLLFAMAGSTMKPAASRGET